MRGSDHSHEFRMYKVTANGIVVGSTLTEYDGILGGTPTLRAKVNGASPAQANVKVASATRTKVGKVAKARRGK
jgi:hypothetical protein